MSTKDELKAAASNAAAAMINKGAEAVAVIALDENGDLYTHHSFNLRHDRAERQHWENHLANYVSGYARHI